MHFVDSASVFIRSGHGGPGCVAFHREKFVPKGGPDGGDGGDGGSVVFIGDANLNTLSRFRNSPRLFAQNGQYGMGTNCSGKKGKTLKVRVPCGTVVMREDTGEFVCEILKSGDKIVVAEGGKGGRGNQHFATAQNQTPRHAEPGLPGVEFKAILELKLVADAGLVGLPNAGKSSLIAAVSNATPKIADYPFTTLVPALAVVDLPDYRSVVMADIPGIIEGAAQGKGLGLQFLKHIERTRVLLFVLDIGPYADQDAVKAYEILCREIDTFGQGVAGKARLIALNKIDLDPDGLGQKTFLDTLEPALRSRVYPISTATRKGLPEMIQALDVLSREARLADQDIPAGRP